MKNKRNLIVILIIVLFLNGCTKILKDEKNKSIIYPITGQNITENILCKPKDKKITKIYKENKIDIEKLPECKEFKIYNKEYEGLWTTLFIRPLTSFIIKIGNLFNNYGVALIIVTFFIRLVLYPATKGTALQSEKIKEAQPELDLIEKKYKNKTDQEEMLKKSQEILMVYKKKGINPLSGCLFAFIQLPIFLAFLETINRTPVIFESNLWIFQLGTTPFIAIKNGQFYYLFLIIILVFITHLSFKYNKTTSINTDAQKQMEFMSKIMLIFITIASFTLSTAISIYWITSSLFTILQNLIVKRSG